MKLEIRDATADDAPAAINVIKRSIVELCVPDHRHDPTILARWLRNKTIENLVSWIRHPETSVLVALNEGKIVAVGLVRNAGMIELNYVSPEVRFRGISRALLKALEIRARERGNTVCNLNSTETARRFYRSRGYVEDGRTHEPFGTNAGYPMVKNLA